MPMADGRTGGGDGRGSTDADHEDSDRGDGDGRGGVEHDAQGAVVGVAVVGMDVGDLNDGEERQQGQTEYGDRNGEEAPAVAAAISAPVWLE